MKIHSIFFAFFFSLFITACATPTPDELASADYGTYPTNYQEIIKSYMGEILKDPSSAQYNFLATPKTGWNSYGGKKFGYVVCVKINAKNSYGGYTGSQLNYFMIKNGKVISSLLGSNNPMSQGMAEGACKNFM